MRVEIWLICAATIMMFTETGCDDSSEGLERLRENRAVWRSLEISDYSIQFQAGCFCPSEFVEPSIVEVKADTIFSVTVVATGDPVIMDKNEWFTIEELFEVAEFVIRKADDFDVEYDTEFGFPVRISADVYKNAIDDEFVYEVSLFQ